MGVRWLVVVGLAGCLEPDLVVCSDGRACAPGLVCDVTHHLCLDPDQLTACNGAVDGAMCETSLITGACLDGICLVPGCGNGVIEPGEQCDDGNFMSGDGCAVDCSSTEECANTIVDPGENCDDGNLISHDGCDSTCQAESVTWRAYPLQYNLNVGPMAPVTAFDPVRQRLVYPTPNSVWEWDGTGWTITLVAASPATYWSAFVYEPMRQRVIGIGRHDELPGQTIVAEWDGTAWTVLASLGTPPQDPNLLFVVFDGTRGSIAIGSLPNSLAFLTIANGNATWTASTPPFQLTPQMRAGFDAARQRLVVVDPTGTGTTWELTGTSWTSVATKPPGTDGWSLVFDGARNALLAVGGYDSSTGYLGIVYQWTGTAWSNTGATIPPRTMPRTWYDPTSQTIGIAGGMAYTGKGGDIWQLAGTTVTERTQALPFQLSDPAFYDRTTARLIGYDIDGAAWSWDGTWAPASLAPRPHSNAVAYDPIRGGPVMLHAGALGAWIFRADWEPLSISWPPDFFPQIYAYDYAAQGIVGIGGSTATYVLPSTASSWTQIGPPLQGGATSTAFDVGRQTIVVQASAPDPVMLDLVGGQWESSLTAGLSYVLTSALHSGTVLLMPQVSGTVLTRSVWERRDGVFRSTGAFPLEGTQGAIVELPHGRHLISSHDGSTFILLERQLTSALPTESCAPGEDLDTDGLAGCADPDCWWTCGPACPRATSCDAP